MYRRALFLLILLAGLPALAGGSPPWTFKTAQFKNIEGDFISITDAGVIIAGGSNIGWDDFLQADRSESVKASAKGFALILLNGDRLTGEPAGVSGEKLKWQCAAFGEIDIPLMRVATITKANAPAPAANDAKRTEDSVVLGNGDTVRGIISEITNAAIVVQSNGQPVNVPLDSVTAAQFASAGASAPNSERGFRVKLSDGSSITAKSLRLQDNKLTIDLSDGAPRTLDLASVNSIEQVNGPVSWLSSRPPVENVHTPFFEASFPAKMNQTVSGKPIRFADKTYARGIGVHSYSRLSWDLDGAYSAFRTQYAIDGIGAYANVTVRIKLDDHVVHEKADVGAGAISDVISVPLGDAKRLTLEVDYGKTYDTQDRLNWIEPALVKKAD